MGTYVLLTLLLLHPHLSLPHTHAHTHTHTYTGTSLGKYRWNQEKARQFYFRNSAGRCFQAWSQYALRETTGLAPQDAAKPEVFFVAKHSESRIVQHLRRVTLRKHLRHWKKYAHPRQIVRRKLLMLRAFNARRALEGWKQAAKKQKQIKQRVVNEWREHCTLLVQVPFRAWFVWAHERRQRRLTQRAVIESFHRRKRYQRKYKIFKLWKHLSIYGKVESLKSRVELIQALETQNAFGSALESTIERLENELNESQTFLKQHQEETKARMENMKQLETEIQEKNFAIHNAEQEIVKMQATLDAVRLIYPHTVNKLKSFAEDAARDAANSSPTKDLRSFVRLRVKERIRSDGLDFEASKARAKSRRRRTSLLASRRKTTVSSSSNSSGRSNRVRRAMSTIALGSKSKVTNNKIRRSTSANENWDSSSTREEGAPGLQGQVEEENEIEEEEEEEIGGGFDFSLESLNPGASFQDMEMLERCKIVLTRLKLLNDEKEEEEEEEENEEEEEEEEEKEDPMALLRFISTGELPKRTYENESEENFGDFLGHISLEYPMKHPLNASTRDRVQARVASQRINRNAKLNKVLNREKTINVYSESAKLVREKK